MNRNTVLVIVAVVVIALTGVVLSQFASSSPDGLEYVAEEQGFVDTAEDHTLGDAPLADYGENLDQDALTATAIAGFVGAAATAVLAIGLFWLARSKTPEPSSKP